MVESRLAMKGLGPDLRTSGPDMAMSGPVGPRQYTMSAQLALTSQIRLSQTVFGWMVGVIHDIENDFEAT